jgi:hypothetical protein
MTYQLIHSPASGVPAQERAVVLRQGEADAAGAY